MQTKVRIPIYNAIRFVPENVEIAEQYHTIPFDKAWFSEQLLPWQEPVSFPILMQNNDPLHLQFRANTDIAARLYVYACGSRNEVEFIDFEIPSAAPEVTEGDTTYITQRLRVQKFFDGYDPGTYFMRLELTFSDGINESSEMFISDPISVKANHPGTLIMNVANSYNKDSVIFEQLRQRFWMRIPAAIVQLEPKVKQTVFIDQGQNTVPIDAKAYRSFKMVIGGDGMPIPDFLVDKLNFYFSCDSIFIDGVQYTPAEGSGLTPDEPVYEFPLRTCTIDLAPVYNTPPYEFIKGGMPLTGVLPNFPFVLFYTEIGYPGSAFFYSVTKARIESFPQLEAWILARNAELESQGFTGTIEYDDASGQVIYNLGVDETFTYGKIDILAYRLGVKFSTTGVATITPSISLSSATGWARYAACNPLKSIVASGYVNTGVNALPIPDYTAPAGGEHTWEVFHDSETIAKFYCNGSLFSGINRYSIAGNLPKYLARFEIQNSTRLTSFDIWTELKEVRSTLETLMIRGCTNLTTFVNNLYIPDYTVTGPEPGWKKLLYIYLQSNNLNSTQVDALFLTIQQLYYEQQWFTYGGTLIATQIPAAIPGPGSADPISELQTTYGFTVTVNT